ncbi:MAG: transporter substrate-binding domain-containing protein [Verrucomicrobiota bacterium]
MIKSIQKLLAISAAAGAFFLSSCGGGGNPSDVLVIGMELNYPPFEMKDKTGVPEGVSIDMAEKLGEHLGMEVEIRDMAWVGLIPALQSGRIDCVISSMTITDERDEQIDFSEPYVKTGICLLVQKDGDIKSFEDLKSPNRRISCKLGTTGHTFAQENLPDAELAVLEDAALCALEVSQGRSDAFIYDQISIAQFAMDQYPDTTVALLEPVRTEVWGVGLAEGDEELREGINAFITKFREDGGFDELGDKWLGDSKATFEELGVEFVF